MQAWTVTRYKSVPPGNSAHRRKKHNKVMSSHRLHSTDWMQTGVEAWKLVATLEIKGVVRRACLQRGGKHLPILSMRSAGSAESCNSLSVHRWQDCEVRNSLLAQGDS